MKNVIVSLLILLLASSAIAQPYKDRPLTKEQKDQIDALRVGIYTRVMGLTEEEAKAFWPVYNAYEEEKETLQKEMRTLGLEIRTQMDDLGEKELEAKLDRIVAIRVEEGELYQKYYEKFKKVLPIKKVALMHKAELEFKRELLKAYRKHRSADEGLRRKH